MCKRVILVVLISLLMLSSHISVSSQTQPYTYEFLEDGTLRITDYTGTDEMVIIPNEIDGKTVSTIGRDAFSALWSVKTLIIPDTVTTIEESAFSYLYYVETIYMSDSVEYIGDCAFFNSLVDRFVLPSSVAHIGNMALGYGTIHDGSDVLPGEITVNPHCVLYAPDNNAVLAYAAENGIRYEDLTAFEKGDLDFDGTINTADARLLLEEILAGYTMCSFISDVDQNGKSDTSDARSILYNIVKA